jgi:hypothetical protein
MGRPETMKPFTLSGGYVKGTLMTITLLPISLNKVQIGFVFRSRAVTGGGSGSNPRATRLPKIACLPGFFPVNRDAQAVGLTKGIVDLRRVFIPPLINFSMLGSSPFDMSGSRTSHEAPSRPTSKTLGKTCNSNESVNRLLKILSCL